MIDFDRKVELAQRAHHFAVKCGDRFRRQRDLPRTGRRWFQSAALIDKIEVDLKIRAPSGIGEVVRPRAVR